MMCVGGKGERDVCKEGILFAHNQKMIIITKRELGYGNGSDLKRGNRAQCRRRRGRGLVRMLVDDPSV